MTTAHRPTWAASLASSSTGVRDGTSGLQTRQISSKDLTAHTVLKLRQGVFPIQTLLLGDDENEEQESINESSGVRLVDILRDEEAKKKLFAKEKQERLAMLGIKNNNVTTIQSRNEDTITEEQNEIAKEEEVVDLDADVVFEDENDEENKDAFSEEDEEAELMRELERIRTERTAERERQERLRQESILAENPLLASKNDFLNTTKGRSWTDGIVFRNQARPEDSSFGNNIGKKRFINDTIRSDFHRKFIEKYIK